MQVWKKRQTFMIGVNLRERRKQLGFTQSDLAQVLALSVQSISLMERGKLKMSPETLALLAKHLDCTVEDLLHSHNSQDDWLQELLDTAIRLHAELQPTTALEVLHSLYNEALARNNSAYLAESSYQLCLLYNEEHKYTISIDWGREALLHLDPKTELERVLNVYTTLGHNFYTQGKMWEAFDLLREAETMVDQHLFTSPQTGRLYYRMAIIKHALQNWESCIWYSERALQTFEQYGMTQQVGSTLMMLGSAYKNQQRYDKAAQHLERSIRLLSQASDLRTLARCFHNLGELELQLQQWEKARKHLLRSLRLKRQAKDEDSMSNTLRALAKLSMQLGHLDAAKQYLQTSLEQLERGNNQLELAITWRHLGDLALEQQQEEEFVAWYKQAIQFFEQLDFSIELAATAGKLGEYYLSKGRERLAVPYLRLSNLHYRKLVQQSGSVNSN